MAKDMTIQDVLDVVATYMNEENVQFIERAYIAARDAPLMDMNVYSTMNQIMPNEAFLAI